MQLLHTYIHTYIAEYLCCVFHLLSLQSPPQLILPPSHSLPLMQLGGPIWADAIHDSEFVRGLLSAAKTAPSGTYHTIQRINGLLTVISEVL